MDGTRPKRLHCIYISRASRVDFSSNLVWSLNETLPLVQNKNAHMRGQERGHHPTWGMKSFKVWLAANKALLVRRISNFVIYFILLQLLVFISLQAFHFN